jgi:hypothetical protein
MRAIIVSPLACPDQHVGVTFEIVDQHAHAPRGPRDFLQHVAQVLRRGRILAEERRVGVLHDAVGVDDGAAQVLERLLALGHPLRIHAVDQVVRILERDVERAERLAHVLADRIERQPVDLVEDAAELRLDAREAPRHHRQLKGILRPVDLHFGASGKYSNAT